MYEGQEHYIRKQKTRSYLASMFQKDQIGPLWKNFFAQTSIQPTAATISSLHMFWEVPYVCICLLAFLFVCFSTSNTLCAVFFFIFFTTAVIKLANNNKSWDTHTLMIELSLWGLMKVNIKWLKLNQKNYDSMSIAVQNAYSFYIMHSFLISNTSCYLLEMIIILRLEPGSDFQMNWNFAMASYSKIFMRRHYNGHTRETKWKCQMTLSRSASRNGKGLLLIMKPLSAIITAGKS